MWDHLLDAGSQWLRLWEWRLYPLASCACQESSTTLLSALAQGHKFGLCCLAQPDSRQAQECCHPRVPVCSWPSLSPCVRQHLGHTCHHSCMFSNTYMFSINLIQFAVFQEIFKISDVLTAFFLNTALDLFRIYVSVTPTICLEQSHWMCETSLQSHFFIWILIPLLVQFFWICTTLSLSSYPPLLFLYWYLVRLLVQKGCSQVYVFKACHGSEYFDLHKRVN